MWSQAYFLLEQNGNNIKIKTLGVILERIKKKKKRFEENLKENKRGLFGWERILAGPDVSPEPTKILSLPF